MRKDLKEAFQLAAESNPIDHYKDILKSFQDELIAQEEARREAAATPKKKKGKAKAVDEDVAMPDFEMDDIDEKPKSKKRKADEEAGVRINCGRSCDQIAANITTRRLSDRNLLRSPRSSLTRRLPRRTALPRPRTSR